MELFRSATPSYRGQASQPSQATGTISGRRVGLFGGGASQPAYKQAGRTARSAQPTSRGWWDLFGGTPQYKTGPAEGSGGCGPPPPPDDEDEGADIVEEVGADETYVW
jgi:hypothetical protein